MIGLILLNAEEIPQPDIVELDHSLGMNNGHCLYGGAVRKGIGARTHDTIMEGLGMPLK